MQLILQLTGIILIAIGLAFLIVDLLGAIRLLRAPRPQPAALTAAEVDPTELLKVIAELLEALRNAPLWLATTAVGSVLVLFRALLLGWGR